MTLRSLFLAALLLTAPAAAHEGGHHDDIRGGATPAAAPAGAVETRDLESGDRRFRATIVQDPEQALVGEEVDVAVRVVELLDPPDPLLGAESPVIPEKAEVHLDDRPLGEAHAEEPEGTVGMHFRPERAGLHRLRFDLGLAGGGVLQIPVSVGVGGSAGAAPWWPVAWLVMAVAVGALVAARTRRPGYAVAGALLGVGGAAALYLADRPASPPVVHQSPPASPAAAGGLQVPPEMQQVLALETEPARRETLASVLEVPGTLAVPGGRSHSLHAVHPGRVVGLGVTVVGQRVRAGQVLAEIEEIVPAADELALEAQIQGVEAQREATEMQRADLAARRAELQARASELSARREELRSRAAERRAELERARRLSALEGISAQELEAARFAEEQARAQLAGVDRELGVVQGYLRTPDPSSAPAPSRPRGTPGILALTSPIDGVVSRIGAASGQVAGPEDELFRVVDLSTMWVRARVPEADLARARGGRGAEVSTAAYPGPFPARLVTVGSEVDPQTRTAEVVYALANPRGELLDGMAATVRLAGASRQALTIPRAAVVEIDRQPHVFVKTAPDRYAPRPVRTEPAREGRLSILEGLEPGDEVVTRGAAQMAAEILRQGGH